MLIKCPKCQTIYQIDDDVVSKGGLKMHCQKCDEVFKVYPEDAYQLPQEEAAQKQNVAKMFEKVIPSASDLFTPKGAQKVRVMHVVRYKNTINYFLILMLLILMGGLLYALRFDVVRYAPAMESFYNKWGIESIYNGSGLEISNIDVTELTENSVSKIKISGIIENPSKYFQNVPPLKIVIYDAWGKKLLDTTHYLAQKRTGAYYKFGFEALVTNPTPKQKNIQITFANEE